MTPITAPNPRLAVLSMLCATLFIASSTLMAKLASDPRFGTPLHPLQISHGRFVFAFIVISSVVAVLRPPIRNPNLKLHAARSALGWSGVTCMFAAVAFIPMADATAISFLNPVFAMVFAIILLREKVGHIRWTAAAIAFAGALILLRPSPSSFEAGALLALTAAVFMGLELIFIKWLTNAEPPLQILFINNAIGLSISTLAVLFVWQAPTIEQWFILGGVGLFMACAQMFFLFAMARADASYVAPFSFATLVFAALFDAAIFGATPDAVTVLGACIILAGAGTLVWRENKLRRASTQP